MLVMHNLQLAPSAAAGSARNRQGYVEASRIKVPRTKSRAPTWTSGTLAQLRRRREREGKGRGGGLKADTCQAALHRSGIA